MPVLAGFRLEILTLVYLLVALSIQVSRLVKWQHIKNDLLLGALYALYIVIFLQSIVIIVTHLLSDL